MHAGASAAPVWCRWFQAQAQAHGACRMRLHAAHSRHQRGTPTARPIGPGGRACLLGASAGQGVRRRACACGQAAARAARRLRSARRGACLRLQLRAAQRDPCLWTPCIGLWPRPRPQAP